MRISSFLRRVMNELKSRGADDVLVAVVNGLKRFPEGILAVFLDPATQTCIIHLLRHSLDFVSYKDRKAVAGALKDIYRAINVAASEEALVALDEGSWAAATQRPARASASLDRGSAVLHLLQQRASAVIHHRCYRNLERQAAPCCPRQGPLPDDQAMLKLLFLGLDRTERAWKMSAREWCMAKAQFASLMV